MIRSGMSGYRTCSLDFIASFSSSVFNRARASAASILLFSSSSFFFFFFLLILMPLSSVGYPSPFPESSPILGKPLCLCECFPFPFGDIAHHILIRHSRSSLSSSALWFTF
uniref:Uncharacterized protein n=1 Tax=Cacopsylla melanoneura TaxID=428564 RepID=A0A8D8SKE7_9HEMI